MLSKNADKFEQQDALMNEEIKRSKFFFKKNFKNRKTNNVLEYKQ